MTTTPTSSDSDNSNSGNKRSNSSSCRYFHDPKRLKTWDPKQGIKNPDVTLVSSDGKEFKANKAILSRSSSYFQAMFSGSFREANAARVELPNINSRTLGFIMDHCYVVHSNDLLMPIDLLRVALMLDFPHLVNSFGTYLGEIITVDNYEKIWEVNQLYQHELLDSYLSESFDKLYTNFLDEDIFLTFGRPFVKYLIKKLTPYYNQMTLLSKVLKWIKKEPENQEECLVEFISDIDTYRLPPGYISHLVKTDELLQKHSNLFQDYEDAKAYDTQLEAPIGTGLITDSILFLSVMSLMKNKSTFQWFDLSGRHGPAQALPMWVMSVNWCIPYKGKVYIVGKNYRTKNVEFIEYDFKSNSYVTIDNIPHLEFIYGFDFVVDNKIFLIGRYNNSDSHCEYYDLINKEWKILSNFKACVDIIVQYKNSPICLKQYQSSTDAHMITDAHVEEECSFALPIKFQFQRVVTVYKNTFWGFCTFQGLTYTYDEEGNVVSSKSSDLCSIRGAQLILVHNVKRYPLIARIENDICNLSLWDFEYDIQLGETSFPRLVDDLMRIQSYCKNFTL